MRDGAGSWKLRGGGQTAMFRRCYVRIKARARTAARSALVVVWHLEGGTYADVQQICRRYAERDTSMRQRQAASTTVCNMDVQHRDMQAGLVHLD